MGYTSSAEQRGAERQCQCVLECSPGSDGKTDKSYQKHHRGEKYEVFAASGCLGNRE